MEKLTIYVREVKPEIIKELNRFKKRYGIKTNSKAIEQIISKVNQDKDLIKYQVEKIQELELELSEFKFKIRDFVRTYESLKNI